MTAPKINGFAPDEAVTVNGWTHAEAAYPPTRRGTTNAIWFRLANQQGWVSFAAVRATPTTQDLTGLDPDGGQPAPTPATCVAKAR